MKVTKEDVPQIVDNYLSLEAADQAKVNRDAFDIRARPLPFEAFNKH